MHAQLNWNTPAIFLANENLIVMVNMPKRRKKDTQKHILMKAPRCIILGVVSDITYNYDMTLLTACFITRPVLLFLLLTHCDVIVITKTPGMI